MKRPIAFAIKLGITAALLWWAWGQAAAMDLGVVFVNADPVLVLAATALHFALSVLLTVRWRIVLTNFGIGLPFGTSWRLVLISQFFNQTLPSSLGGDAVRIWMVSKVFGKPLNEAAISVFADRLLALIAIPLFALAGLVLLPEVFGHPEVVVVTWPLMAGIIVGTAVVRRIDLVPVTWRRIRRHEVFRQVLKASEALRTLSDDRRAAGLGIALSVTIHIAVGIHIWLLAEAVGLTLGPVPFLVLTPVLMLIALIPVTISGWGLRESAMVAAYAYLGAEPALVFATSVLFGVTMIVAGIPGGILWIVQRGRPTESVEPGDVSRPV